MRILVIAAHPDDEVLGMGGTIKKHAKKGDDIKIMIMATGINARRSINYKNSSRYFVDKKISQTMEKQVMNLRKNAVQSSKILGAKRIQFMDFPDNEMDTVSLLEVTKTVEKHIEEFNAEIVYTHSNYDINIDHQVCYNATIIATRPRKNYSVKKVISFEVASSTEWYFPSKFSPNIFVDISKEMTTKLKALKIYKQELRDFPHPRSLEAIEAISKRWGSLSGFKNAEAFCLVRELTS